MFCAEDCGRPIFFTNRIFAGRRAMVCRLIAKDCLSEIAPRRISDDRWIGHSAAQWPIRTVDRACRRTGLLSCRTVYVYRRRRFVHWESIRTPGFAWEFTRAET